MWEKMGETHQLAMWEIGRMPDSPSPPLSGHYSLGNIRLWMHGGQRLVYLLNNLGSWVAFSVMQRRRLTVCRRRLVCPQSRCILYYLCQLARLPLRTSSPQRQKTHRCHLCTHLLAYIHICKYSRARTHTHTPAHFHPNELVVPHVHDIHPTPGSNFHVDETVNLQYKCI